MRVTAKATRSGAWWAIEVPEVPGLFTQAKRLDQVEAEVIDAAGMLGVVVDQVLVEPDLSTEEGDLVKRATRARALAESAAREASSASRAAVSRLRSDGLTVRDVASILGVSAQRVSVLDEDRTRPAENPVIPVART